MRDVKAESVWNAHPIIGYVPLDENGNPYQPKLGSGRHKRTKPVTVYSTMARAITYSPVNSASEVRMFKPIEIE